MGNSPDEFFFGPEVPDVVVPPEGGYRDREGRLKRQAARFRVYGYDANGKVVCELTHGAGIEIAWTVEVANKKSSWYMFNTAMDLAGAKPVKRRNARITGTDRAELEIRPSPRTVAGPGVGPAVEPFDDGTFFGKRVYLGELQTDDEGRLIFLGGRGVSASYDGRPVYTFANNDGWHDDTCDGPVHARVSIDGREIPVRSAWVSVAPPDYAPDLSDVVTMQDILENINYVAGSPPPGGVSFRRHILPLFTRMADTQWANKGFLIQFGMGGVNDFLAPPMLRRLASPSAEFKELRNQVFLLFRNPNYKEMDRLGLPPIYGDLMSVPPNDPRQWLTVTPLQYARLGAWAQGDFTPGTERDPKALDDLPVRRQPAALDAAALDACLGGPFHPGCEMTWPMRNAMMYDAWMRIKQVTDPEPDYGESLTHEVVMSPRGPLDGSRPGDITRWMAVPWQTDTASCRSGYDAQYDEFLPTFWAARVPNQVMTRQTFDDMKRAGGRAPAGGADRLEKLFLQRADWDRPLGPPTNYFENIANMIHRFGDLGVLEREDVDFGEQFPRRFLVENLGPRGAAQEAGPENGSHPKRSLLGMVKIDAEARDRETAAPAAASEAPLVRVQQADAAERRGATPLR